MTRPPHDVPEAQLAVLRVLWELDRASRRQITDALYPGGGPSAFTTVQKLLERLEQRSLVRRHDDDPLTFSALVSRDELISLRLSDVAEQLCSGSITPLLLNLVNTRQLTAEELADLRAVVRRLSQQARDTPRS